MNVEIKYNSPLRFLDYDVSQYLYENYFPSSKAKDKKNIVNDQYKYYLNDYLQHYNLNNIYERNMIICIRRNHRWYSKKSSFDFLVLFISQ